MAQKVNIVLVDDLDGTEATETVSFGLDGTTYEIDLNDANAAALREALSGYVGHARKVTGGGRRSRRSSGGSSSSRRPPTPRTCASGPRPRAWRSPSAAASPPTCSRPTTPPTDVRPPSSTPFEAAEPVR